MAFLTSNVSVKKIKCWKNSGKCNYYREIKVASASVFVQQNKKIYPFLKLKFCLLEFSDFAWMLFFLNCWFEKLFKWLSKYFIFAWVYIYHTPANVATIKYLFIFQLNVDLLQSLTGDGVMNVQEFVSRVVNHNKPPTPSASTPYRQLKRHHSTQVRLDFYQVTRCGLIHL